MAAIPRAPLPQPPNLHNTMKASRSMCTRTLFSAHP
ncbi:hypothetical protein EYZ11_012515 [Aspergillus tanneri]|uniref:Uncharacterized protein n=1 Tax=Aspergillus tanneri TaxID=1220188 RepID=A0A4S3J261_9EURO|nr:hypothetical protein EYZ11_012515 [Aspergillus tanneri]